MSLQKQIQFIVEIDKLKNIIRRNFLVDSTRKENTAEHSWHIAMMAITLSEYAENIDILKTVKMLLIHDIVEIDAGDTYIHDIEGMKNKKEKEQAAAIRLFGLLPQEQNKEFTSLWNEFENNQTLESQFANAIDRFHPFLLHINGNGMVWKQNQIRKQQIIKIMEPVRQFPLLWKYLEEELEKAYAKGWLQD